MTPPNSTKNIKVWDWSIRVFHWSLPVLIFLLWFSQDQGEMDRHFLFGKILLGMLVYRFIWGVIGTPYARFKHFLYGPKAFVHYAKNFFSSNKPRYLSHNPPGGFMVLVLLGAVSFQLVTGLFTTDDIFFSGPLYDSVSSSLAEWMTKWHYTFFNWLLVLIGLHLFAIALYKWLGEGLVKAMFSGEKEASEKDEDLLIVAVVADSFPWVRFVFAVIIAIATVAGVFYYPAELLSLFS